MNREHTQTAAGNTRKHGRVRPFQTGINSMIHDHFHPIKSPFLKNPTVMPLLLSILLLIPSLAGAGNPDSGAESRANPGKKTTLLFSIDQGFDNGVLANGDVDAVTNMVRALEPLRDQYRVCVLLNPMIKDKQRLKLVLDSLAAQKMPFVFDVYTSDAFSLGSNCAATEPYDSSHGLTISVEQLAALKKEYGPLLAGLRFMEVFGLDYTVRALIKGTNPEIRRPGDILPDDDVFQPGIAEGYIRFAKDHDMFVQWADFQWGPFAPWDKRQPDFERQVVDLLRKYPGVVTVTYNNNAPNEVSLQHLDIWQTAVEHFPKEGAAGYGLSNQSWLRNFHHLDTTPEEMIHWSKSALDKGCGLIQFEPAWYFFHLPFPTFKSHTEFSDNHDYTKDPKWAHRGEGTENLNKMISFLLAPETAGPRPATLTRATPDPK